jgi:hypothetical protein
VLLAPFDGVDQDQVSLMVDPCQSYMRDPSGMRVAKFAKVLSSMRVLTESGSGFADMTEIVQNQLALK